MLVALSPAGARVLADMAPRGADYRCPACQAPVVLKQGRRVLPHFAHRPQQPCPVVSEPETAAHIGMKRVLWTRFGREPWVRRSELEWVLGARRADVWLETAVGPVALEGQVSPLTVAELAAKLGDYTARGIATLYVVHHSVLAAIRHGAEVRVPAWVLALHALYRGRVLVYRDDGALLPLHLVPVLRDNDWGERSRVVRLKTTRRLEVRQPLTALKLRCALLGCDYGALGGSAYLLALPER